MLCSADENYVWVFNSSIKDVNCYTAYTGDFVHNGKGLCKTSHTRIS